MGSSQAEFKASHSEAQFSEDEIGVILETLASHNVFPNFRSEVQTPNHFFDPDQGYVDDVEEMDTPLDTRTVFDHYREALIENNPVATQAYDNNDQREAMIFALEPNSRQRAVLLSYYSSFEKALWNTTVGNIVSTQRHRSENFPQYDVIQRICEQLNQKERGEKS